MARCNLCGFLVLRIWPGMFGTRCLACFSTFIHRAVGVVIDELRLPADSRVYELSTRGALVAFLKRRFSSVTCSEYFDDVKPGEFKGAIQCQDVQGLTYHDGAFDLVTSTEVFEHVPDDRRGFGEIYRVLKPGGYFVLTVPLADQDATVERACLRGGEIVHLLPPEYHGDRIRGLRHVLAFRTYGRDIASRLQSAGFKADIRTVALPSSAISNAKVIVGHKP